MNDARANKFKIDWSEAAIVKPEKLGVSVIDHMNLETLKQYIDWSPFFRSWDLHGRYPDILTDKIVGPQATELFEDAQQMLEQIISENLLVAKGIFGLFKANTVNDDDIEVEVEPAEIKGISYGGDYTFRTLRQQSKKAEGRPNIALADFIAPKETGIQDYVGCFCVSTGFGTAELAAKYEADNDDYNSIMGKSTSGSSCRGFLPKICTRQCAHRNGGILLEND